MKAGDLKLNRRRGNGTLFCSPGTGYRAAIGVNTLRFQVLSRSWWQPGVALLLLCLSEPHPGTLCCSRACDGLSTECGL